MVSKMFCLVFVKSHPRESSDECDIIHLLNANEFIIQ